MKDVLSVVEEAFRWITEGKVLQLKNTIQCPNEERHSLTAFPCYVKRKVSGIKWLGYSKSNREKGLPTITAILVLNNDETNAPISIMDASRITAMRTAAHAGVAAKYLARKNSTIVSIIGCGVQGRTHVEAMNELFKIREVKAYNRSSEGAKKFVQDIETRLNLEVTVVDNPSNAVKDTDIVCMTTSASKPLVMSRDIEPGCFIAGTALFHDLDPNLSKEVDKWVLGNIDLDFPDLAKSQSRIELSREDVYGELGEIITGTILGRKTETERILFSCGGMGVLDVSAGLLAYNKAKEKNVGLKVDLF